MLLKRKKKDSGIKFKDNYIPMKKSSGIKFREGGYYDYISQRKSSPVIIKNDEVKNEDNNNYQEESLDDNYEE